jgi:uncharacterized protein DUF4062
VFVSSTLGELAEQRQAVSRAVTALRMTPVMFELGARPHPPRELCQALLSLCLSSFGRLALAEGEAERAAPSPTTTGQRSVQSCL